MSEFVLARFAGSIGEAFAVVAAPGVSWTLVAADGYGDVTDPATHGAFTLLFRGAPDPVFAGQIVTLQHPTVGEVAIFVNPIARDEDGVSYEAIFS